MTRADGAAYATLCHQAAAQDRIRHYLRIRGDRMSARRAAAWMEVHPRTIQRWRRRLRIEGPPA